MAVTRPPRYYGEPTAPVRVQIIGGQIVLANLVKAEAKHAMALERGLVKAGLWLMRKSQEIVPVDTGYLKSTAYTLKKGYALRTVVYVGYTASYAIYVHEILTARHTPPTKAKFLEGVARSRYFQIHKIIAQELAGEGSQDYTTRGGVGLRPTALHPASDPLMRAPRKRSAILRDLGASLRRMINKGRGR